MKELTTVNEKDLEISLQFSFTNLDAIPQFLEDLPEENTENAVARRQLNNRGTGTDLTNGQFLKKMVDLRQLPIQLLRTNYELIGAWKQQRLHTKAGYSQNKPYWMIRFRFRHKNGIAECRSKMGEPAWEMLQENRPILLGELVTICSLAFWQMRAWRNPYYRDGIPLPNAYAISLNFEGRKPLYEWDPPRELGDHDLPPQFKPDAVFNIQ